MTGPNEQNENQQEQQEQQPQQDMNQLYDQQVDEAILGVMDND